MRHTEVLNFEKFVESHGNKIRRSLDEEDTAKLNKSRDERHKKRQEENRVNAEKNKEKSSEKEPERKKELDVAESAIKLFKDFNNISESDRFGITEPFDEWAMRDAELADEWGHYMIKAEKILGISEEEIDALETEEIILLLREEGSEKAIKVANKLELVELGFKEQAKEIEPIEESFTSLTDEQRIKLHTIIDGIIDNSMEKVDTNSEVANPKGRARNPFYDRGSRQLQGLGKPFGGLVPGSVEKEKGVITAEVTHGVRYESGLNKEYRTQIKMDEKTLEYTIKKLSTDL